MKLNRYTFDYFYMFVMVIYMAAMAHATNTLFSVSSDVSLIGILIPNILTLILILQNQKKIKRNKWLGIICTLVGLWIILIARKFGIVEARSGLYTLYYILIAYIQISIFEKKIFSYYEDIMVKMSKFTLVLWILGVILPPIDQIYTLFPYAIEGNRRSMDGYNILYLFCWNHDPSALIPRNAGFSWEPGRYAIMLALAILINIYRKGINFRNNPNVLWLLVSLVSTMSTTGFSIVIVLYTYFAVKKLRLKYLLIMIFVFGPLIYGISRLDFMGAKIKEQFEGVDSSDSTVEMLQYNMSNNPNYHASLGRFMAIFFEMQNITQDPIIGYGPTTQQSFFTRNIAENATLTGGILKIFGRYGIPLGMFFYFVLFRSSVAMARVFGSDKRLGLFLCMVMSMISYDIFCKTLFVSFWFFGVYCKSDITETSHSSRGVKNKIKTAPKIIAS